MLSKNKWYKYIILSSLCYAMVDNFGKSFCSCHCCDKDDSGGGFWSRMPVNLSRYNLLDGCYALLSYEHGDKNCLINLTTKIVFYLPSNVKKKPVEGAWKNIPEDLDATQTDIVYYHGVFNDFQSIKDIFNPLSGVFGKGKLDDIHCYVDRNVTVILTFGDFMVMFKNKKGFFMSKQGPDLEEFFNKGVDSVCSKCEHVINFKIKKYNGPDDVTVSFCVACGNFVPTLAKNHFCWFLSGFNSDISGKQKNFELLRTKNKCSTIDDYEKIDLAGYQYLKFLKEGVSVNGVTYPDTVLLWGKQLYEILAEKWNL